MTEVEVLKNYPDLFEGLGLLKGEVHFEIDESVQPVQMPLRRLPLGVRDKVAAELERLEREKIIAPVTEPSPWVSALLVVAKQDGRIRLCIDPKPLNKALKRAQYYMPTIDDVLPMLAGAKVFSTVNAKDGFWHLKLDDESSKLTTFETPFGRKRWLRAPFGAFPVPEIFQAKIYSALTGLRGVGCIADDILIVEAGDTEAAAVSDHKRNLRALLDRCFTPSASNSHATGYQRRCSATTVRSMRKSLSNSPETGNLHMLHRLRAIPRATAVSRMQ